MAKVTEMALLMGATTKTSSRIEKKLSTALKQPKPTTWVTVAAQSNGNTPPKTTTTSTKTTNAAAPATKPPAAKKQGVPATPAQPTAPLSKCDRRIIVRREAFRDPVPESRLLEIRDAVNAAVAAASKSSTPPKVAAVTINQKKSYILSTLGNTPASEILKHRANVEAALCKIDKSVLHIEGDKKWYRLIIHGIHTNSYGESPEGMTHLRTEIESYNPSVTLINNPRWLTRPEKREGKKSSSVSIALESKEVAMKCVEKGLRVDMQLLQVAPYIVNRQDQQCSNCQRFGHHFARCPHKQPVCRLCGASHKTTDHKCPTCNRKGSRCEHLNPFCGNCQVSGHTASDNSCAVKKSIRTNRPTQPEPQTVLKNAPATQKTTTTNTTTKPKEDQEMGGTKETL